MTWWRWRPDLRNDWSEYTATVSRHNGALELEASAHRAEIATLRGRLEIWKRIAARDWEARRVEEAVAEALSMRLRLAQDDVKTLEGQLRERAEIQANLVSANREAAQEIDRLHDQVRRLQEAATRRRRGK